MFKPFIDLRFAATALSIALILTPLNVFAWSASFHASGTDENSPGISGEFLYVGNAAGGGGVYQYSLPLTPDSMPDFMMLTGPVSAMSFLSSGEMITGESNNTLHIFSAPISSASTVICQFPNGPAGAPFQFAPVGTGGFWSVNQDKNVYLFDAPFSDQSVPKSLITNPALSTAIGVTLDQSQNLYVSNTNIGTAGNCSSGAGTCSDLLVFSPPYTGAPVITANLPNTAYREITVRGTRLFAASVTPGLAHVDVYDLPITSSSVPAFSIASGMNSPEALAFDSSGNLYVANVVDATVKVYAPPFSNSSMPSVSLDLNSLGTFGVLALAVSPPPAAPTVTVAGRVTTPDGSGLRNATVSISTGGGPAAHVLTSSLGFYQFDSVEAGKSYVVSVQSKRYRFQSKTLQLNDDVSGVDFVGLE